MTSTYFPLKPMEMADTLTPSARSERMGRVRGRDTKPEMIVRRLLHGMGYRYRLQARDLPGRPDIVLRPRKKAIFVHGCFWHRHLDPDCKLARLPKTHLGYSARNIPIRYQRSSVWMIIREHDS